MDVQRPRTRATEIDADRFVAPRLLCRDFVNQNQIPAPLPSTSAIAERTSGVFTANELESALLLETVIEVVYPADKGAIGLRGSSAPLSWEHTEPPVSVDGDTHVFKVILRTDELLELKVVRGEDWATGRNYHLHAGDHVRIEPYFDHEKAEFEMVELPFGDKTIKADVLLPPSYMEQPTKRYPVLYALDGQSLWSHSQDPFGIWELDGTLASLNELGVVDELIVVAIHTGEDRLDLLGPVEDSNYKGGKGHEFLSWICDSLRPHVNERFRTQTDRNATGILGSSMGGLFAFFAAYTMPEIFGRAACLSSSFWWADRWAVRLAQSTAAPSPRPVLYIDSGASPSPMEEDARLLDGFHHTRSMFRALTRGGFEVGVDLHRLVFPGMGHNAGSWASRVSMPLQMLFPKVPGVPQAIAAND